MKLEDYKNCMRQLKVPPEKKEELWADLVNRNPVKRKRRYFVPLRIAVCAGALLLLLIIVNRSDALAEHSPGGLLEQVQEFFHGLLATEDDPAMNQEDYKMMDLVERNIYCDENSHVRMEILEKLSDGVVVLMTVRYTGLDEAGLQWIAANTENGFIEQNTWIQPVFPENDLETYGVNYMPKINIMQDMDTVTERYFRVELYAASREYMSDRVVFRYRMPEDGVNVLIPSPKEVELNASTEDVDVVIYDIVDRGEYPGYELRRLYVSGLSYVIYAKKQEGEAPEGSDIRSRSEVGLICSENGEEYRLMNTNFAGSPAAPREENRYSDVVIQGGCFYDTDQFESIRTFDPHSVKMLVFYDEEGEYTCDLIKLEEE